MAKVCVFFADGFEDIEGLTVVDVLRRGKVDVKTVSVTGSKNILTSHGVPLVTDELFENIGFEDVDAVVLPGGLKGTNALMAHEGVKKVIKDFAATGKYVCAICAAPSVLGMNGLLEGKKATCYPGFEEKLLGAECDKAAKVVKDGNIITSRGMGTSIDFALAILAVLTSEEKSTEIARQIQFI